MNKETNIQTINYEFKHNIWNAAWPYTAVGGNVEKLNDTYVVRLVRQ